MEPVPVPHMPETARASGKTTDNDTAAVGTSDADNTTTSAAAPAHSSSERRPSLTTAVASASSTGCVVASNSPPQSSQQLQRRQSRGSTHRRAKSDPISDADKISIRSGEVGGDTVAMDDLLVPAGASASDSDYSGRPLSIPATAGGSDDDLVQIGDGAFVSRRVYDLSRAAAVSNDRSMAAIPGMSKLLNFAGRLPNLPTRHRSDNNSTTSSSGGGTGSNSGGGSTRRLSSAMSSLVDDIPGRRSNVLSKLSGGLFGRPNGSNMESAADAYTLSNNGLEQESAGDGVELTESDAAVVRGSVMRPRSISASASVPRSTLMSSPVSPSTAPDGVFPAVDSVPAAAPVMYTHSISVPAVASCGVDTGSCVVSSGSPSAAGEVALAGDFSNDLDGMLDVSDDEDVDLDCPCTVAPAETVLQSKSDSSLSTGGARSKLTEHLVRHRSYDDIPQSSAAAAAAAECGESPDAAGAGAAMICAVERTPSGKSLQHRSHAERVALTATQPFRRVLKQLMKRSNSDGVSPPKLPQSHGQVTAHEATTPGDTSAVIGSQEALAFSDSESRMPSGTSPRKAVASVSSSKLPPHSAPVSHRRSTSFSGRLPFLANGRGPAELSIRDLVDSGCSITASATNSDSGMSIEREFSSLTIRSSSSDHHGDSIAAAVSSDLSPARMPVTVTGATPPSSSKSSIESSPHHMPHTGQQRRHCILQQRHTVVTFGPVTTAATSSSESSPIPATGGSSSTDRPTPVPTAVDELTSQQRVTAVECSETDAFESRTERNANGCNGVRLRRHGSNASQASVRSRRSSAGSLDGKSQPRTQSRAQQATFFSSATPAITSLWRPVLQLLSVGSVMQGALAALFSWVTRKGPLPRSAVLAVIFLVASVCMVLNWRLLSARSQQCQASSLETMYARVESVEDYRRLLLMEDAQYRRRIEYLKSLLHETESALKEVRYSLDQTSRLSSADKTGSGDAEQRGVSGACQCDGESGSVPLADRLQSRYTSHRRQGAEGPSVTPRALPGDTASADGTRAAGLPSSAIKSQQANATPVS
ncbi:uncharacterized protein LOC135826850 [Sycon ciliatum]|uniref:uncharacterized protein LOC135826850 n=1 Tax=Sycon ciliatum TaxID=27933 RepID=UPI0031F6D29A